jgi:hypothetical protein
MPADLVTLADVATADVIAHFLVHFGPKEVLFHALRGLKHRMSGVPPYEVLELSRTTDVPRIEDLRDFPLFLVVDDDRVWAYSALRLLTPSKNGILFLGF